MTAFAQRVYEIVSQIKQGHVMTYKDVAQAAGSPGAYRAVGTILSKNRDPAVPCHRVIKANGTPGGYAWGTIRKARRLREEGVTFTT